MGSFSRPPFATLRRIAVSTALTAAASFGLSGVASAGSTTNATPACNTNANQWVIPLTLQNQIYATLLSALAAYQTVSIWGDGCAVDGSTETSVQIQLWQS